MTLKPCPNPACRSEDVELYGYEAYVGCSQCSLRGPGNDPTGEKWNNLLRVEDVEAAYREGAINRLSFRFSDAKSELDRRMGK